MTYRTSAERAELAWRFHRMASPAFGWPFEQAARAGMKNLEAEEHYYGVAHVLGFTESEAYALLGGTLPSTEDGWWTARQRLYVPRRNGTPLPGAAVTESQPDAFGAILHAIVGPSGEGGPPYTHDLTPRRCEACAMSEAPECRDGVLYRDGSEATDYYDVYAGRCGCVCHGPQPSYTVETAAAPNFLAEQLTAFLPPEMRAAGLHFEFEAAPEAYRAQREEQRRLNRLYWSGPDRLERRIGHAYRIKPKLVGIGPPPLAIDGHAYHQRQRNRVKRKNR